MIILVLALLLLGCFAVAGWSFGAIRAAFSFFGILAGLACAKMFGHALEPVARIFGFKNPVWLWVVAPFIAFLLGIVVFKIVGLLVHRKVALHFKNQGGELRSSLWKRLNVRLGICVGLLNGAAYLILICGAIYVMSQVSTQLTSDNSGWSVKLLNSAGKQLQSTGMAKVAAAIDPMPATFYEAADLAGLLYHNILLEARLSRYPAFLALGEKEVFQQIANDSTFTELRQRQPPVSEILHHAKVQPIVSDPELLKQIWALTMSNFDDLEKFLRTGNSGKYDSEKILGRWEVNVPAAVLALRQARATISGTELQRTRAFMNVIFERTTLVATLEKQALLKNVGRLPAAAMAPQAAPGRGPAPPPAQAPGGRGARGAPRGPRGTPAPPPAAAPANAPAANVPLVAEGYEKLEGTWTGSGNDYQLRFGNRGTFHAVIDGDRMTVTGYTYPMVLDRIY